MAPNSEESRFGQFPFSEDGANKVRLVGRDFRQAINSGNVIKTGFMDGKINSELCSRCN